MNPVSHEQNGRRPGGETGPPPARSSARMNIVIANRQRLKRINPRSLRQLVKAALAELAVTDAELGINLVAEREMTLVNETFLQHAGPTDVITFDHAERRHGRRAGRDKIHGELFVCVDVAAAQAGEFQTTWQAEAVRYVVHGILHLLGHDDLQPQPRRAMKRVENRLVRRLAGEFSFAELSRPAQSKRRRAQG